MHSVDLDVGDRGHNGQARSSIGGDGRSNEDDESGTEEREHCNLGGQCGWRDGRMKP